LTGGVLTRAVLTGGAPGGAASSGGGAGLLTLPPLAAWSVIGVAAAILALLVPLALHRLVLLHRARGAAERARREAGLWEGALPPVTIQLPVYNEAEVVERLARAAVALDYPPHLLEVQILDDSTDETTDRVRALLPELRAGGVRVEHLHRDRRTGFKAGALAEGLRVARGAFLLVLDADFLPDPDLVRRLLPPFADPRVGMVQARWDHLNEGARPLTRGQALLLDGHFWFEQGGRYAAGRFMNFNGTAGMWRREALDEAGGWSSDTLTEDLDASYRAQMAGWRFVYLGGVGVPAELPEGIRALEIQQKRWAQGGVETGRKLLPALWRGPWSRKIKVEATFHLVGHLAHPLTVVLGILLLPSAVARRSLGLESWLLLDLLVFAAATGSFLVFYLAAARARTRGWWGSFPQALLTMALGVGLTAPVSRAVLRGVTGRGRGRDLFHRTPKGGRAGILRYRAPAGSGDLAFKLLLAAWMACSAVLALRWALFPTLPFLLLFGVGWGWLGLGELLERGRLAAAGGTGDGAY
jgi:cellulose synthase/poly-beta-1,6-N-acetylglucosamine synthase-like glycosyltransferase